MLLDLNMALSESLSDAWHHADLQRRSLVIGTDKKSLTTLSLCTDIHCLSIYYLTAVLSMAYCLHTILFLLPYLFFNPLVLPLSSNLQQHEKKTFKHSCNSYYSNGGEEFMGIGGSRKYECCHKNPISGQRLVYSFRKYDSSPTKAISGERLAYSFRKYDAR